MQTSQNGKLAFTVTWRARDGEADACATSSPVSFRRRARNRA